MAYSMFCSSQGFVHGIWNGLQHTPESGCRLAVSTSVIIVIVLMTMLITIIITIIIIILLGCTPDNTNNNNNNQNNNHRLHTGLEVGWAASQLVIARSRWPYT